MSRVKTRAELKAEAKDLLRGRWGDGILLNLVPTLSQIALFVFIAFISAAAIALAVIFFRDTDFMSQTSTYTDGYQGNSGGGYGGGGIFGLFISLITIGISFTFLDWLRQPTKKIQPFKDAFQVYTSKNFLTVLVISILSSIFTFLWSLLFVIPGIIKALAYSQSYFIYKDLSSHGGNEGMRYTNYITESRQLMDGHKGRYFLLQLSFIGWHILALLTLGIGYLWLNPYMSATYAAFYKDLAQDRYLSGAKVYEDVEDTTNEWTND